MQLRTEKFLDLSTILTGASRLKLVSTGMADIYLRTLDDILSLRLVDAILPSQPVSSGVYAEEAVIARLLGVDPKLQEILGRITLLWYTGSWTALSDAWRAANGVLPKDTTHVISVGAYESGLQWTIGGSHAPGSLAQGFGSWSSEPGWSSL